MPRFYVTVTKKIEVRTLVTARDEQEAKANAWAYLPDEVDDWHCDIHNGTKYKVELLEMDTGRRTS